MVGFLLIIALGNGNVQNPGWHTMNAKNEHSIEKIQEFQEIRTYLFLQLS